MHIYKYLSLLVILFNISLALENAENTCYTFLWDWAEGDGVKNCKNVVQTCIRKACSSGSACNKLFKYSHTNCEVWRERSKCDVNQCIHDMKCKQSIEYKDWILNFGCYL